MDIKVLGPGCSNCKQLLENVKTAVESLGLEDATIEYINDYAKIMSYGVMTMPVLVVDGKVAVAGRVPPPQEIAAMLTVNR